MEGQRRHLASTIALDLELLWLFADVKDSVNYVHAGHDLPERREPHAVQPTIVPEINEPAHA